MAEEVLVKEETAGNPLLCSQAGLLPVPLRCVPVESLINLEIYLQTGGKYSLYNAKGLHFGRRDAERLLERKIEYVYISVKDHQVYYETMEKALSRIVGDPNIQEEKKTEILYATAIELSNQLLAGPPGKEEVKRAANVARSTVELIMRNRTAFGGLYEIFNHDFYTATHLVNVCGLSISLAQKMGLFDVEILQQIGTGGLLHDVGKVFVPNEILNTTERLTAEQFETIKNHVMLGRQHLEKVMLLSPEILAVVSEHHERMDGSGYPKGLRNEELSPLGRLAGIVDTFDAMTSVRPYRSRTFSVGEALQELEEQTPKKFDKEIVNAFTVLIEKSLPKNTMDNSPGGPGGGKVQISAETISGAKCTQFYFRIPITVRKLEKAGDKLTLGPARKLTAHKITCVRIGFLSDLPFLPDQNIVITNQQLESIGMNKLIATISRCINHRDGWYTVEAEFIHPLPMDIIDKLKTITAVREVSLLSEN